jgi:hypothetical protein
LENYNSRIGKRINRNSNMIIQEINVDGDSTDNPHVTACVFNEYFLLVAEKLLFVIFMAFVVSKYCYIYILFMLVSICATIAS